MAQLVERLPLGLNPSPGTFQARVCMFSLCLHGFSSGNPAFSHTPLNCPCMCECKSEWLFDGLVTIRPCTVTAGYGPLWPWNEESGIDNGWMKFKFVCFFLQIIDFFRGLSLAPSTMAAQPNCLNCLNFQDKISSLTKGLNTLIFPTSFRLKFTVHWIFPTFFWACMSQSAQVFFLLYYTLGWQIYVLSL